MKHAVIVSENEAGSFEKKVEIKLDGGTIISFAECEYDREELDAFNSEKDKWIVRCAGTQYFLADSDSGEDARGYYCNYFDLDPEHAVFDRGKLVGFYFCYDRITYSGRGRYNFSIDDWGYPGANIFSWIPGSSKTHLYLFADSETHNWDEWTLIARDPEMEYKEYLYF